LEIKKRLNAPKDAIYSTKLGSCIYGNVAEVLGTKNFGRYKNNIDLIFTSPPFPLNRKKKYGNFKDDEYLNWFSDLSLLLSDYLSDSGSIVIEIGNSWNKGSPTMSTLALKTMLKFLEKGGLHLCQQFIWYNTAKLPTPAPWVTINRVRVKDAFTHIWWMSKTQSPKADNRKVLVEYSAKMKKIIESGEYNHGRRPSNHNINNSSFLADNGGAIPSNVLISSNTDSKSRYLQYCRKLDIQPHPARMPLDIPEFFIKLLTDPGDLVFDPFCGSNTTGQAAEELNRRWLGVDANIDYLKGSLGRFDVSKLKVKHSFE